MSACECASVRVCVSECDLWLCLRAGVLYVFVSVCVRVCVHLFVYVCVWPLSMFIIIKMGVHFEIWGVKCFGDP